MAAGYHTTQGSSNLNQKSSSKDVVNFWQEIPTPWHQERTNGAKNGLGTALEGPGLVPGVGKGYLAQKKPRPPTTLQ